MAVKVALKSVTFHDPDVESMARLQDWSFVSQEAMA